MFGIGMPELMIIFVIALLVFGPKELPKIAKTLGKAMSELRRASDELRDGIQREIEIATREERETPSTPPEAVPSSSMGEASLPPADGQWNAGTEGQVVETAAVIASPIGREQGSQEVTEAILPVSKGQSVQHIPSEAATSPGLPAEPGQAQVTPEEVTKAAAEGGPAETPKESSSISETVPHVPAQPAETRNA